MNISIVSRLVMIEQSLFGLPWVIAAALLGLWSNSESSSTLWAKIGQWDIWLWIVVAFTAARTAGMAFNRLIDRHIDATNPRTAQRSLPRGEITAPQVLFIALASVALFIVACASINNCCLLLSPIVVILLWLYSYTKRFTAYCHFVLGSIHFFSSIFAWAAMTNSVEWTSALLGMAIWASITGNDILYALQDRVFDMQQRLHSIPARWGVARAVIIARCLHSTTVILLFLLGIILDLGPLFFISNAAIMGLYFYFHRQMTAKAADIGKNFFYCNSAVASLFLLSIIGILWHTSL